MPRLVRSDVYVRMPGPLYSRLAAIASEERRSLSAMAVILLERAVTEWERLARDSRP